MDDNANAKESCVLTGGLEETAKTSPDHVIQNSWMAPWKTEHLDIFLFSTHHSMVSISDVLFNGGRGASDFSVLKYY